MNEQVIVNPARCQESKQTVRNIFLSKLLNLGVPIRIAQLAVNKAINYLNKKPFWLTIEWDKPSNEYPTSLFEAFSVTFLTFGCTECTTNGEYTIARKLNKQIDSLIKLYSA